MKRIFAGLVITSHVFALTASNSNDVSIAATQQVQAAATQNTLVQLLSQSQNESPADDMHTGDFYAMAEWHGDIMNDVAVTYEMAGQIAIDHAGIAKPDVANLRSIMNRNSDNPIWNFTVAGTGLMVSIQIDSTTGEIVRSRQSRGSWPTENLPISFDEAAQIAIDHANISPPFIAYFHGHTTLPNGNQFWRVHIDSHSGVYDIHVDVFTGEVIRSR